MSDDMPDWQLAVMSHVNDALEHGGYANANCMGAQEDRGAGVQYSPSGSKGLLGDWNSLRSHGKCVFLHCISRGVPMFFQVLLAKSVQTF